VARRITSIDNRSDRIGNVTREFPASSRMSVTFYDFINNAELVDGNRVHE
jgi:hypothetical protein